MYLYEQGTQQAIAVAFPGLPGAGEHSGLEQGPCWWVHWNRRGGDGKTQLGLAGVSRPGVLTEMPRAVSRGHLSVEVGGVLGTPV